MRRSPKLFLVDRGIARPPVFGLPLRQLLSNVRDLRLTGIALYRVGSVNNLLVSTFESG